MFQKQEPACLGNLKAALLACNKNLLLTAKKALEHNHDEDSMEDSCTLKGGEVY